jgi:hypothetical protein
MRCVVCCMCGSFGAVGYCVGFCPTAAAASAVKPMRPYFPTNRVAWAPAQWSLAHCDRHMALPLLLLLPGLIPCWSPATWAAWDASPLPPTSCFEK